MPKLQVKQVDIKDIIDSTIELYRDVESIQFKSKPNLNMHLLKETRSADKGFNNLVNNAIQAISDDKNGDLHSVEQKRVFLSCCC